MRYLGVLVTILGAVLSSCDSGASCECTLTINGTTKTAKTCGEKLCFSDGSAFECSADGSKELASCNGGSGGGTATGGGSSATGGGSGGGTASGGGGGSSGPSCTGTFACGAITCNAATELCNTTFSPARCVANTTACRNRSSYCISATGVTQCQSGKRFSCNADPSTGGVTAGCQ